MVNWLHGVDTFHTHRTRHTAAVDIVHIHNPMCMALIQGQAIAHIRRARFYLFERFSRNRNRLYGAWATLIYRIDKIG